MDVLCAADKFAHVYACKQGILHNSEPAVRHGVSYFDAAYASFHLSIPSIVVK
jgi:hypothetical protein